MENKYIFYVKSIETGFYLIYLFF